MAMAYASFLATALALLFLVAFTASPSCIRRRQ
jgi:hypothetical protein